MARMSPMLFLAVAGCTTGGGRQESVASASVGRRDEAVTTRSKGAESTDHRSNLSPAEARMVGTYILGAGLSSYATLQICDFGLYAETLGSCVGHPTSDYGTWQLEDNCIVLRSERPLARIIHEPENAKALGAYESAYQS